MGYALRGLTYEQWEEDREYVTAARTVTEADVSAFAGLSGDFNPLHTDETFAATTPFGKRIAHGMLTAAMATGMVNAQGWFEGTTIALMEQVFRYKGPVMFGDTIHCVVTINNKKETSKPGRGVIAYDVNVVNQDGKTVLESTWTCMMKRSESE
ncbi:MAG: MaoC/PaaZ C-terminal domain-containing protein [Planctomycetota bacterium]|jgi:acyl dehydratase